jgi:hypothetical protein
MPVSHFSRHRSSVAMVPWVVDAEPLWIRYPPPIAASGHGLSRVDPRRLPHEGITCAKQRIEQIAGRIDSTKNGNA